MAASNRARDNVGELLVTAALLGLSLAANLWASVYFKRHPFSSSSPPRQQTSKAPTAASSGGDKPSSPPAVVAEDDDKTQQQEETAPASAKSPPAPAEKRTSGGGGGTDELADVAMGLLGAFSAMSTVVLTLLLYGAQRRAFPRSADGFLLSVLVAVLSFALGSMARRWRNFFDWVICAYAAAALGYAVEARFRCCNQLIDNLGGV